MTAATADLVTHLLEEISFLRATVEALTGRAGGKSGQQDLPPAAPSGPVSRTRLIHCPRCDSRDLGADGALVHAPGCAYPRGPQR